MSFLFYKKTIEFGDFAIVLVKHNELVPIQITKDKILQNCYGHFNHNDFVNHPYGTKFKSSKGFICLLHPTPQLWTLALPHRTQILYKADISLILTLLRLKPGSIVLEAGTGSGSLSHSICNAILPTGHLYTFEYHAKRHQLSLQEFKNHQLNVTCTLRNVCKDGFGMKNSADCVFLDLPSPWEVIEFAKDALFDDKLTRICCFSPCIEQVLKTTVALENHGFKEIKMFEFLIRNHELKTVKKDDKSMVYCAPVSDAKGHTSYLCFANKN